MLFAEACDWSGEVGRGFIAPVLGVIGSLRRVLERGVMPGLVGNVPRSLVGVVTRRLVVTRGVAVDVTPTLSFVPRGLPEATRGPTVTGSLVMGLPLFL